MSIARSKTKAPSSHTTSSTAVRPAAPLSEFPALSAAVDRFMDQNACFKSSIILDELSKTLMGCDNYTSLFEAPLKARVLTMEGALLWAYFLSQANFVAIDEGDKPFSPGNPLNLENAFQMINAIYDLATKEVVHECFEPDEDEDEDEGEGEGEDEEQN